MKREEQEVRLEIVKLAGNEIKVNRPLYKRPWFWGIVIAVVICIGWSSAGAWAVLSGGAGVPAHHHRNSGGPACRGTGDG